MKTDADFILYVVQDTDNDKYYCSYNEAFEFGIRETSLLTEQEANSIRNEWGQRPYEYNKLKLIPYHCFKGGVQEDAPKIV